VVGVGRVREADGLAMSPAHLPPNRPLLRLGLSHSTIAVRLSSPFAPICSRSLFAPFSCCDSEPLRIDRAERKCLPAAVGAKSAAGTTLRILFICYFWPLPVQYDVSLSIGFFRLYFFVRLVFWTYFSRVSGQGVASGGLGGGGGGGCASGLGPVQPPVSARLNGAARLGGTRMLDNIASQVGTGAGTVGAGGTPSITPRWADLTLEELMLRTMMKRRSSRATSRRRTGTTVGSVPSDAD